MSVAWVPKHFPALPPFQIASENERGFKDSFTYLVAKLPYLFYLS